MPEPYDLSKLLAEHPLTDTGLGRLVDLSGRPIPKDVRVKLNSGMEIRCDVKYDGIDTSDDTRRYVVFAEIDWENYWPLACFVGEYPRDVTIIFRSNCDDHENAWRAENLRVIPERIIEV